MKQPLYLETSVISYLAARPSADLVVAGHQLITRRWWESQRPDFTLYVSEAVIEECAAGDPEAAARRLALLADIPVLMPTTDSNAIAKRLMLEGIVPAKAVVDAMHLGIAAAHGVEYLLTWNCAHIANAALRRRMEAVCRTMGKAMPVICTPEELLED
ncbi:MAG: type II toxin-antitoxin system VapC family toxin [Planctomycetes bacterium]|nr:type II toxin-antitoxin system VapC family toxin [Planctomycetota bacterium]